MSDESKDVVSWREYEIHREDEEEPQAFAAESTFQLFPCQAAAQIMEFPLQNNDGTKIIRLECQEDYTQSTGMAVWTGSEALCEFLQQKAAAADSLFENAQQVLELGSGMGLCSIAAYCLGLAKNVLATDGDSRVLEALRQNVERNRIVSSSHHGSTISCHQLIWGKHLQEFIKEHGKSDVILASDVFYMTKSLKPLFETVQALMEEDGVFVAANLSSCQSPMETVLSVASSLGFSYSCPPNTEDIYLFRRNKEKTHQGS